ncbi:MAG: hypothetical protein JWP44_3770 [Mucilaginibacter sp.]|nr:hypothetical protein [Mucilaginibacter sp.]
MRNIRDLHRQAMELVRKANEALAGGDNPLHLVYLEQALVFEKEAAYELLNDFEAEPTRSVLFRSAASLAVQNKDVATALELVSAAFKGEPPAEIRGELNEIVNQTYALYNVAVLESSHQPDKNFFAEKEISRAEKKDFNLVLEAQQGNMAAYSQLMHSYKNFVYHKILRMVIDEEDAMDLTVETLAIAFEQINSVTDELQFSTWLYRVAINRSINFIRKNKLAGITSGKQNQDEIFSDVFLESENELSKRNTAKSELLQLISKLPVRYRDLLNLRYFEELSYEDIAEQLGLPLGTVKLQLNRARHLLGNLLNRQQRDDS